MRRNGYSVALREYEISLSRARHLYSIERRRYADPPKEEERVAVEALRGGATVLMVASLERYLRDALEEFVELIAVETLVTTNPKLAPNFVRCNDYNFFEWLVRERRISAAERSAELKRVSQLVASNRFVPEAFSRTRANPGPATVKELFRDFGIRDAFGRIEMCFGRHFKDPFPKGFVEATLGSIVNKRNEVAHGGYSHCPERSSVLDHVLKVVRPSSG